MCKNSKFYSLNQLAVASSLYQVHVYMHKVYQSNFYGSIYCLKALKEIIYRMVLLKGVTTSLMLIPPYGTLIYLIFNQVQLKACGFYISNTIGNTSATLHSRSCFCCVRNSCSYFDDQNIL